MSLDRAIALMNRGLMWNQQGRFEMGFPLLEMAHKMEPTCREAGTAYAEALLRRGDFKLGFYLHNHYRLSRSWFRLNQYFPEWQGEPLEGKRILVVEEGGTGDCLMMLRYVPLLERAGAKVTLSVRPDLKRLVQFQSWCNAEDGPWGDAQDSAGPPDYWISLTSLPLHFGIHTWDQYIWVPRQPRSYGVIGFSWKAGAVLDGGNFRSLNDEQCERVKECLGEGYTPLINDIGQYRDWAETASVITSLDCVITVDTGVMHLSAAMGKPTYVLLGSWSDWKFGLSGDTMPWYPTIKLFRGGPGGFDHAIDLLKVELDRRKELCA